MVYCFDHFDKLFGDTNLHQGTSPLDSSTRNDTGHTTTTLFGPVCRKDILKRIQEYRKLKYCSKSFTSIYSALSTLEDN